MTKKNKQVLQVHISKEYADQEDIVRMAFGDLPVKVSADHWRLSEGDLAMQVTIFLGDLILKGVMWDLLKAGIKKLRSRYPKAGIAIRDENSILYAIKPNEEVAVIVVPDRKQEFTQIKTLDDLIKLLSSSVSVWKEIRLNSLIKNLNAGVSVNSTDRKCAEPCSYILKTSSVHGGIFNPSEKKIVHEKDKDRASVNPQAGQILISRMNTPKLVGETAYVPETYPYIFLPDRIWQTEFHSDAEVDTHWLAYLFQSNIYNHKIKSLGTGTSGSMKNISKKDFLSLKLNLPPLPEQKRIVAVLETWDKAIDLLEKKIELKEQLKKGLMQQLLTGKKRLPGFNGEWEEKKLGDICVFKKGKGLGKKEISEAGKYECIHYGELFLKYAENIDSIISKTNHLDKKVVSESGDILMPTSDVTPRGLSTASFLDKDGVILGGDILIIRCPSNELNGLYFSYYVNANKKEVIRLVTGSTVFHLYGSDMARFRLKLPPKAEQEALVSILVSSDNEMKLLTSKLQNLKDQKKYILNNLVTGKIRTPEDMKVTSN
jgi:type I restriction enzyme, S subunit